MLTNVLRKTLEKSIVISSNLCTTLAVSRRFRVSTCFDCFFFFQAEDGIRDLTVTGVQTCALPISCRELGLRPAGPQRVRRRRARGDVAWRRHDWRPRWLERLPPWRHARKGACVDDRTGAERLDRKRAVGVHGCDRRPRLGRRSLEGLGSLGSRTRDGRDAVTLSTLSLYARTRGETSRCLGHFCVTPRRESAA